MRSPDPATEYLVTAVGTACPLEVGEQVRPTGAWAVDFLGGGIITSFDVRRASGEVVTIARGPRHGAVITPIPTD